ncbi:hypothetical protein KY330_05160 [Candidatus Woesearchaeota archaeon]|nr:hypothetical protein [Candidatus Woesearchaeota archaeon]
MKRLTYLVMFVILISIAAADLGPKPSAEVELLFDGRPMAMPAKMLECRQSIAYSDILDFLEDYNEEEWDSKCREFAVEYGENPGICMNVVAHMKYINETPGCGAYNLDQGFDEELCKVFYSFKQPDFERGCVWKVSDLAWTNCNGNLCNFNYMLPDEFRIVVYHPTAGMLISDAVERRNFYSSYVIDFVPESPDINAYRGMVIETTPIITPDKTEGFVVALVLTLLLEFVVALIFLAVAKLSKKVLITVLIANIVSLPIVWFLFPVMKLSITLTIILSEVFAVGFETYAIHLFHKKIFTLKRAFFLSLVMNMISLFVGGFLYIVLKMFRF